MNPTHRIAAVALGIAALTACASPEHVTTGEALEAIGELNRSGVGEEATTGVIEISTDVTIGDRLESAAEALADFWRSQADCTTVTVAGPLVTIDYGTLADACVWNGHTYAGVNTIGIVDTTAGALEVEHTWTGFTDGDVQVDGDAQVTWSGSDQTRRVVTSHTWTDLATDETMDVDGDHIWGVLETDAGWLGGFTLDGNRGWTSESGVWDLEMSDVEVRLQDPCPQAGSFLVTLPRDKELELVYTRLDDATIEARVTGTREDIVFHINRLGIPEQVDGSSP